MIISVWRYSHLMLAISSFLLLTLAAGTGMILAFDPVTEQLKSYGPADPDKHTLAATVPLLKEKYKDVQKISVNDHGFVILDWTTEDGTSRQSYVDPGTGRDLGPVEKQSDFFQWVTSLHRSLFLHDTGRLIMGITAFLLVLIAASGIMLVLQRQKSLRRFFAPIERDHFAQYYHVVFGRVVLFPILVIAITGALITAARLQWIKTETPALQVDFDKLKTAPVLAASEFPVFRNTRLSSVQSIEFPFSEDVEDYYILKLNNGQLAVNQLTGEVVNEQHAPAGTGIGALAMKLHTGRIGIVWALILAVSCGYILFFIYSGFAITFRRRANRSINRYNAAESEIVILVGSEAGTTMMFAKSVYRQLLAQGQRVYLTDADNYQAFPLMERLIFMTSTYGLGDPPSNARKFKSKLGSIQQPRPFSYSVLAFGSRAYSDFCAFGLQADEWLSGQEGTYRSTAVTTVDDRSIQDFSNWCEAWSKQSGLLLQPEADLLSINRKKLRPFAVTYKSGLNQSDSFVMRLEAKGKSRVRSGDLIAVYPANDHHERLYSIGVVQRQIQLSVRHYPGGLGSAYLFASGPGDMVNARHIRNKHFNFPRKAKAVIMVSNGTGIAPFLGMLDENKRKLPIHLFCGFRFQSSLEPYHAHLSQKLSTGQLAKLHPAMSREGNGRYVTELLQEQAAEVSRLLLDGAVLMICGSLAMEADVLKVIDAMLEPSDLTIETLREEGRLKTDCY